MGPRVLGCNWAPGCQREREPRRQEEAVWYKGVRSGAGCIPPRMSFLPDRARDTQTDEIVALKKVRMDKEKDGEQGRDTSSEWAGQKGAG